MIDLNVFSNFNLSEKPGRLQKPGRLHIRSGKVLYSWRLVDNSKCYFYEYNGEIYYHLIYQDGSFSCPQIIKRIGTGNRYEYVENINDDYFLIDDQLNLEVYQTGKLKFKAALIIREY